MTSSIKSSKVIVIGAGISGIKAAKTLHDNGIETLILEGRDRIGGRLNTITPENSLNQYDIGACWFHATTNNELFDLCISKGNIDYYFDDNSVKIIGEEGEITTNISPIIDEIRLFTKLPRDKDTNLKQIVKEYLDKNGKFLTPEQLRDSPRLFRVNDIMNGTSWEKASGKLGGGGYGGRDAFCISGYSKVLDNVIDDYPREKILLNSAVTSIDKSTTSSDEKFIISTNNGNIYECEYLIITVPLSVLKNSISEITKSNSIEFKSNILTNEFKDNLNKNHFVALSKVIVEFDKSFWPNVDKFIIVPTIDSKDEIFNNNNNKDDTIKTLPFNSIPENSPKPFEFASLVSNLQNVRNIPALMFLIPEPASFFIENDKSENKSKTWELIKPLISKISNISESELPIPKILITTNWSVDPYSQGSISGNAPNDEFVNPSILKGLGKIRFAGEHAIADGHGCAHGAYASGKREAEYIINDINGK